jgi:hypothetical protein
MNTCPAAGTPEDGQPSAFASTEDYIEAHGFPFNRRLAVDGTVAAEDLPLQQELT